MYLYLQKTLPSAAMLVTMLMIGSCGQTPSTVAESPSATPPSAVETSPSPSPTPTESIAGTAVVSPDGDMQITVPEGWKEDRQLNDQAQLQAANLDKELYLIVLSEAKADLPTDMNLVRHSEITRSIVVENLSNAEVTGPTAVTRVGDYPAVQYEIRGTLKDINVLYVHTTVETGDRFNQILAWTLPDNYNSNKEELQRTIASFRELTP
ncbi:MAG TPA: hypothetical protein V6C88_06215 [Chroococcidiopsis sp.]